MVLRWKVPKGPALGKIERNWEIKAGGGGALPWCMSRYRPTLSIYQNSFIEKSTFLCVGRRGPVVGPHPPSRPRPAAPSASLRIRHCSHNRCWRRFLRHAQKVEEEKKTWRHVQLLKAELPLRSQLDLAVALVNRSGSGRSRFGPGRARWNRRLPGKLEEKRHYERPTSRLAPISSRPFVTGP